MSEYLPITPQEIAESAIGAAEAGAAIVHLHARNPQDGSPTSDPDVYAQFLPRIKEGCGAIVNITTGGGLHMTVDQRIAAAERFKPEMTSLNMGSINIGLFHLVDRYEKWQEDWEREYLASSRDFIFRNTFADIESIVKRLGEGCGVRFEFECYDVGHLYNLAHFLERGVVKPPLFVQTIFGLLGGIGPDTENLVHMRRMADKLFGDAYEWSILGAGKHQTGLVTTGAIMGGHVRVGLEDNLYLEKGVHAKSNAEQVAQIRQMLESLSLEIATPDEARQILNLKGVDQVAF